MACHEVWNFVNKFYQLRNTGKNASLTLKSKNGKVVVNLQLDIYDQTPTPPQPPRQNRPSPSRLRRTERRARARRESAAANAAFPASSAVEAVLPSSPPKDIAVQAVISTSDVAEQATIAPDTTDAAVQVACAPAKQSSIINVPPNTLDMYHYQVSPSHIPQVDGSMNVSHENLSQMQEECDNCHTTFGNKSQLDEHNDVYQYGCEDCGICFTSKERFDFHELEKHPETGYARDIVPQATKLRFADGLG